jgi:hypothetical protein
VWWHILVILALRKLRQEDGEFKASLDYIVRTVSKKKEEEEEERRRRTTTRTTTMLEDYYYLISNLYKNGS